MFENIEEAYAYYEQECEAYKAYNEKVVDIDPPDTGVAHQMWRETQKRSDRWRIELQAMEEVLNLSGEEKRIR